MALLGDRAGLLAKDKVPSSIPIWNTEVNYGLTTGVNGGTPRRRSPTDLQVAYVMRTYLLNAAQGVKRVDWYAYDMGNLPAAVGGAPLGNTLLTDPADRAAGILTPAGLAFQRVQSWMAGTMVGTTTKRPCIAEPVRHLHLRDPVRLRRGPGLLEPLPDREGDPGRRRPPRRSTSTA